MRSPAAAALSSATPMQTSVAAEALTTLPDENFTNSPLAMAAPAVNVALPFWWIAFMFFLPFLYLTSGCSFMTAANAAG